MSPYLMSETRQRRCRSECVPVMDAVSAWKEDDEQGKLTLAATEGFHAKDNACMGKNACTHGKPHRGGLEVSCSSKLAKHTAQLFVQVLQLSAVEAPRCPLITCIVMYTS